jgi:hypothetical protein
MSLRQRSARQLGAAPTMQAGIGDCATSCDLKRSYADTHAHAVCGLQGKVGGELVVLLGAHHLGSPCISSVPHNRLTETRHKTACSHMSKLRQLYALRMSHCTLTVSMCVRRHHAVIPPACRTRPLHYVQLLVSQAGYRPL